MKKLFFLVFFLISTTLFAQDFTLVDWNNWQVDYEDPKQLRLAYLKIISDFPKFPAKEFLTYEEFLEKKSQLKFDRQLPQTFGQLKAHILEEQAPVATETFSLSQEEVPQALVEDLKQWKDSLNSRTFPTEKIRLEVAIAYCKVLGEKTVKEFLSGSERYDLRNELLEPIATLLKTDPAWGFRRDILAPIMRYQIFSGTTFTLELLEMVTSDPNHMVQLELLRLLQESNIFSYTLLRPTLIQLIEEDENSQVKAAAQAFLKELEIKYQVATRSLDGGVEFLGAPSAPEEEAEPPTTRKKIRGSTRHFQKPDDILTKIRTLQRGAERDATPLESNDPRIIPYLEDLIFSEKERPYLKISAIELLFHFPDQMMPILERILKDKAIEKDLKRMVLNSIVRDLPAELVPIITEIIHQEKEDYTVRMLSARALLSARRPSLAAAILKGEERTRILARIEPLYRQFPDQFTGMFLSQMKDQKWEPRNIVPALERTYRYYHPSELPENIELWLKKIHEADVLRELVRLKDPTFENIKPHIQRALKISIR